MLDLNDLSYFAGVVTHGGFGPASRALRLPKSKLSRRIAQLEERLGVRLIERTTRRFQVTDVGRAYYERCRVVIEEAEAAEAVVAETHGDPKGLVRFSCPPGMLQAISGVLPQFLDAYPGIRLQILATNEMVDLIDRRIDLALRVRTAPDPDSSMTVRTLATAARYLVASPKLAASYTGDLGIDAVAFFPTLSFFGQEGEDRWTLFGPDKAERSFVLIPRMTCGDIPTLRQAAIAGVGVAYLPDHSCRRELNEGRLVRLLPDWASAPSKISLVFTTRRGLPPAVRAMIDYLAAAFNQDLLLRDLAAGLE